MALHTVHSPYYKYLMVRTVHSYVGMDVISKITIFPAIIGFLRYVTQSEELPRQVACSSVCPSVTLVDCDHRHWVCPKNSKGNFVKFKGELSPFNVFTTFFQHKKRNLSSDEKFSMVFSARQRISLARYMLSLGRPSFRPSVSHTGESVKNGSS